MTTRVSPDPDPPPSQHDHDVGLDKFMLHDVVDIRAHLRQLIDRRCTLIASGKDGAVSMLTAPLAVDSDRLWVDVPPSEAVLQRLLQCARVSFEGTLDKIQLRFSAGPPSLGSHGGRPALHLPLPSRLLHLQRRELMRREPPPGALRCVVPARGVVDDLPPIVASIRDIGGGGLAVLLLEEHLALTPGDLLPGCAIELSEQDTVEVTLRVCHVRRMRQRGIDMLHVGCEFVDLPGPIQSRLFRYVMQLDRELLAGRRG